MRNKRDPAATLQAIRTWIAPLDPPVASFASHSRHTPFRTLISVLLSSRTRDETTAAAASRLFARAGTPEKMLRLGENRVSRLIYPVGFYRQKTKNIMAICRRLRAAPAFPSDFQSLISLPGVGRKTANLVLALAFHVAAVAVDTHVFRISRRLGWARGHTPQAVEEELKKLFAPELWRDINQVLVGFGQTLCRPLRPLCDRCFLPPHCPDYQSRRRKGNKS